MAMLALATSGPRGEVGLRSDDGSVRTLPIGARTRGRELAPAIQSLLEDAGLAPSAVEAIAVDVGPGSFTGVRVGVTTAKTLSFALRVPVMPLTSLAVLAHGAEHDGPVVALRDAGRGRAYLATYGPRGTDGVRPIVHAAARGAEEEIRAACADACAVGESVQALLTTLSITCEAVDLDADARLLLSLADVVGVPQEAHDLAPAYLQASAPERLRAGEAPGPQT